MTFVFVILEKSLLYLGHCRELFCVMTFVFVVLENSLVSWSL
jgi:hypothetical protein